MYQQLTREMMFAAKPSMPWKAMSPRALELGFPELAAAKRVFQRGSERVFDHTMKVLDILQERNPITLWAAIFHDVGKEGRRDSFIGHDAVSAGIATIRLAQWQTPPHDSSCVTRIVETHMFDVKNVTARGARHFVSRVGIDNINNWFIVREADVRAYAHHLPSFLVEFRDRVEQYVASLTSVTWSDILITEEEMVEILGEDDGRVRTIRDRIVEGVRSGTYPNDRDTLLEIIKKLYEGGCDR